MVRRSPVSALPVFDGEGPGALGEPADFIVDLRLGHLGNRALDRDRAEIGKLDLGKHLVGHGVGEVGLTGEDLLRGALFLGKFEVWLKRRAFAAVGEGVAGDLIDDALNDLGHGRPAVEAAKMADRYLARAKPLDADLVLELVEPRRKPAVQFGGRNDHLELAPQSFDHRRIDLHSL